MWVLTCCTNVLCRYCTVHIIRNMRSSGGCEKSFHDNMVWRLQGSRSVDEYAKHLNEFTVNFPKCRQYLAKIDCKRWVLYAMVEQGAATFGWRSNNMGEQGQGNILNDKRSLHPLQFFSDLQEYLYIKLTSLASKHKAWQLQADSQPIAGLVPHAVALFKERTAAAVRCHVTPIGRLAQVQYMDPETLQSHPRRLVDPDKKQCTCLCFQDYKFPCKCAIAFSTHQGKAANLYVKDTADSSYHIAANALASIVDNLEPLMAPTPAELAKREIGDIAVIEGVGNIIEEAVRPPPKRVKETHGNSTRKRKLRRSARSTGRTRTASFAAAAAAGGSAKARRTGACAICTAAGRTDVEAHQSSMCPWSLPDVNPSEILALTDDSDE